MSDTAIANSSQSSPSANISMAERRRSSTVEEITDIFTGREHKLNGIHICERKYIHCDCKDDQGCPDNPNRKDDQGCSDQSNVNDDQECPDHCNLNDDQGYSVHSNRKVDPNSSTCKDYQACLVCSNRKDDQRCPNHSTRRDDQGCPDLSNRKDDQGCPSHSNHKGDKGYGSMEWSTKSRSIDSRYSQFDERGNVTKSRTSGSSQSSGFGEKMKYDKSSLHFKDFNQVASDNKDSNSRLKMYLESEKNINKTDNYNAIPTSMDFARDSKTSPEIFSGNYCERRKINDYPKSDMDCSAQNLPTLSPPPEKAFVGENERHDNRKRKKVDCLMNAVQVPSVDHVTNALPGIISNRPRLSYSPLKTKENCDLQNRYLEHPATDKEQPNLLYKHALHSIQTIKESKKGQKFIDGNDLDCTPLNESLEEVFRDFHFNLDKISVVLNTTDGKVIKISAKFGDVFGFQNNMVLGRPFIQFVYRNDSAVFASKLLKAINMLIESTYKGSKSMSPFFCRILEAKKISHSSEIEICQIDSFKVCQIDFSIFDHEIEWTKYSPRSKPSSSDFLLADILPIPSYYKVPDEIINGDSFTIRHSASCNFSEYDPKAIQFLGHLPQDLTGNSIFDCYHPEDLPLLLKIYQEVIQGEGKPYRSQSYRFRTFNGSWVLLQTDWICFINPWSRKIDSIIGRHKVLKGPRDIAIYAAGHQTGEQQDTGIVACKARRDIVELLSKPISCKRLECNLLSPEDEKTSVATNVQNDKNGIKTGLKKCKPTTVFCVAASSSTLPTCTITNQKSSFDNQEQLSSSLAPAITQVSKGESLLSSSESPSTYSRLNYSSTLLRFFQSNPRIAPTNISGESKQESSTQDSDEGKSNSPQREYQKFTASLQALNNTNYLSGYESLSGDTFFINRKNGSKDISESGSGSCESSASVRSEEYQHVPLTQEILSRHNHNMQLLFMEKQKKNTKCIKGKFREKTHINKIKLSDKSSKKSTSKTKRPCSPNPLEALSRFKYAKINDREDEFAVPGPSGLCHDSDVRRRFSLRRGYNHEATIRDFQKSESLKKSHNICEERNVTRTPYPLYSSHSSTFQPSTVSLHEKSSMLTTGGHHAPSPSLMLSHHHAPFINAQGVVNPVQYMGGGYREMYITPRFDHSPVLGAMPPNIMLPAMVMPSVSPLHCYYHDQRSAMPTIPANHLHSANHLPKTCSNHQLESHRTNIVPLLMTKDPTVRRSMHSTIGEPSYVNNNNYMDGCSINSIVGKDCNSSKMDISNNNIPIRKRTDSRTTSVKVEPGGSVLGSVASAPGHLRCSTSLPPESIRSEADDLATINEARECDFIPRVISHLSHFSKTTSVLGEAESVSSPHKHRLMDEHQDENNSDMDVSIELSGSDTSKLLTYTSCGTNEAAEENRPVLNDPHWLSEVDITPHLLYRYQLDQSCVTDVLSNDLKTLLHLKQSDMVNEQLQSLYQELNKDGEFQLNIGDVKSSTSVEENNKIHFGIGSLNHFPI